MSNVLGKNGYKKLQKVMAAGEKLPSWTSHKTGAGQTSQSGRASAAPNLPTVSEEQPANIQAAVDASEDMQLAIREFGLTGDLYMVLGVRRIPLIVTIAEQGLSESVRGLGILGWGRRKAVLPQASPTGKDVRGRHSFVPGEDRLS